MPNNQLPRMCQFYLLLALVLVGSLVAGCNRGATSVYRNSQFGISVAMPAGWETVENAVSLITGRKYSENTIGFRSELSLEADWLYVEVKDGKSAQSAVLDLRLFPGSAEYKVQEYGKNGYLVRSRFLRSVTWTEWRSAYYIEYNNQLYIITFKNPRTEKRVFVSIDGYGKVNY